MANTRKISIVDSLHTRLNEEQDVAIVGIHQTTHIALETLRRSLAKIGGKITVVKVSLLEKALQRVSALAPFAKKATPIKDASALITLKGDWTEGIKAIAEFSKKDPSVFFKWAFLDSTVYDEAGLKKLASLPSKSVLLAKVIGSFKSPMYRVDTAIKFPMTYLVNVLKAKSNAS